MGWLHSRPKHSKDEKNPRARIELYPEFDPILAMPDADEMIVSAWHAIGLTGRPIISPMGDEIKQPVSWSEIAAYSSCAAQLTPWECRLIKRMSNDYIRAVNEGSAKMGVEPYFDPELTKDDLIARSEHHFNMF